MQAAPVENGKHPHEPEPLGWEDWARDAGAWVRRVRTLLGLSQHALARRVGVSQAAVSRLEAGRANVMAVPAFLRVVAGLVQGVVGVERSALHEDLREQLPLYSSLIETLRRGAPRWPEVTQDPGAEEVLALYLAVARERRPAFLRALKTVADAFGGPPRIEGAREGGEARPDEAAKPDN